MTAYVKRDGIKRDDDRFAVGVLSDDIAAIVAREILRRGFAIHISGPIGRENARAAFQSHADRSVLGKRCRKNEFFARIQIQVVCISAYGVTADFRRTAHSECARTAEINTCAAGRRGIIRNDTAGNGESTV